MPEVKPYYHKLLKFHDETKRDVDEICNPLFTAFQNINYFSYIGICTDHTFLYLHTSAEVINREWLKKYNLITPGANETKDGVYCWEDITPATDAIKIYSDNNIKHGASIVTTSKGYTEMFSFGTQGRQSYLLEFCYNHRDSIEQFLKYFKDKGSNLIKASYEKNVIIKDRAIIPENLNREESYKKFCSQFLANKVILTIGKNLEAITYREYQCLMHLSKGKTFKEIGRILDISYKTVENHLANIKVKTGCFLTSQLIDMFWENFENRV